MQRFVELLVESGEQDARNASSSCIEGHAYFRMLENIDIARHFVHDDLEAYFVDAIADFVNLAITHRVIMANMMILKSWTYSLSTTKTVYWDAVGINFTWV